MDIPTEATALETKLRNAGIGIQVALQAAGLDRSTWTRWKTGKFKPRLESWLDLQREAGRLLAEQPISSGGPREVAS